MKEYPEDIPWGEFMKKLAVLLGIAVVYVAVQLWISWPSIKWMVKGGKVEELKGGKVCGTFQLFNVQLFNFPKGGAS